MAGTAPNQNAFIKGIRNPQKKRNVLVNPSETVNYTGDFFGVGTTNPEDIERRKGVHLLLPEILPQPRPSPTPDPETKFGSFLSAQISKLDGKDDDTTVLLGLDGRIVVEMSFKKAKILGLEKQGNPFGIVFHKGKQKIKTLTIGFCTPLYFELKLQLFVKVAEPNVSKIEGTVIWGTEGGGGGDVPGGGSGGHTPFP